jgi:hypothetical protein
VSGAAAKLGSLSVNFSSFEAGNKGAIALLALYVYWKFMSGK